MTRRVVAIFRQSVGSASIGAALLPLCLLMQLQTQVSAQIPTKPVVLPSPDTALLVFDGTKNFMGTDVKAYTGQDLFMPCRSEGLREYGYDGFYTDYRDAGPLSKNVYKKIQDGFSTQYHALVNRTFTVTDVILHPGADRDSYLYGTKSYLRLIAKDTKETVYFEYDSQFEHTFPFIAMKFFERQKSDLVGKEFITRGRNWIDSNPMTDMNTGKPIDFPPGAVWKGVDVVIESRFCGLALVLQGSKGEQIPLHVSSVGDQHWVFEKSVADSYRQRFGEEVWAKIVGGVVAIGMTTEQAQLAWDAAESKNKTAVEGRVLEQWVYKNGQYLYVENGKVTGIQR